MVCRLVVQAVLLVSPSTNPVWNSLDVIPDLLIANIFDVRDLRVLDSELITEVRVDNGHAITIDSDDVLDCSVTLGLVQAVSAALIKSSYF